MATRSDIAELKGEMQSMEVRLKSELKAAIAWSSNKTVFWMAGLFVAAGVLHHFFK